MSNGNGFLNRSNEFLKAAAASALSWYDSDGNWFESSRPPETRERYWLAFALYNGGNSALADALILKGDVHRSHLGVTKKSDFAFDIFHSNVAAVLLTQWSKSMSVRVRTHLENLVTQAVATRGQGDRSPVYQFHGYNDNMPAKSTLGLILGGDLLGIPEAVDQGIWNLRQLRALLGRCGTIHEWNSPTYSPITIHALAEIAERSRNPEARELALKAEQRLWVDLAARFHPEIGSIAGPYSRAYTIDTLASLSCAASLQWFVLGDLSRPSPMLLYDLPPDLVLHHEGDVPYNVSQTTWFAAGTYHVPAQAMDLFERKRYPFRASASYERGYAGPDFPARAGRIDTLLERDFTLGASSTEWLSGEQTMSYFVSYKRKEAVRSFRDVGTIFSKFVLDDQVPGTATPTGYSNSGEVDLLPSKGATLAIQADTTAMVLTHPHLGLGLPQDMSDDWDVAAPKPVSRLSELIIFPSHHGGADEILVDGVSRKDWAGDVPLGAWIACRRGRLFAAFRPLQHSQKFGPARVTLERHNNYEVIRATFYGGEARMFTRNELRNTYGGFVAEHASVDEYPSLSDFFQDFRQSKMLDYLHFTRRARYFRPQGAKRPSVDIETSCAPASASPRFVTINGLPQDHQRLHYDGIDVSSLPLLNEPFDSSSTIELPF